MWHATTDALFASAERSRLPHILLSLCLCLALAVVDWKVVPNLSLGLLYIIPLLIAALVLGRVQMLLMAAGCSLLREQFSFFPWQPDWEFRLAIVGAAFAGAGLFVIEYRRSRAKDFEHREALSAEIDQRLRQEQVLRTIVQTSPLAIVIFDAAGRVELANAAASSLFGYQAPGAMSGTGLSDLVPSLSGALTMDNQGRDLRAAIECQARTRHGEPFLAHVWFSTFDEGSARRLAAVLWDESESLRSREVANWESLLASTRGALGSALHELRNFSRQAGEAHRRLAAHPALADSSELHALGRIVEAMEGVSSDGLRTAARESREVTDLSSALQEIQILEAVSLAEEGIHLSVQAPPGPLRVRAGHQQLLQVLLNLLRNARRELASAPAREVNIEVRAEDPWISVEVSNSGRPVADPSGLFRAFVSGSDSTGLGLFISRALMRSCGGELRYEARGSRPCFIIELMPGRPVPQ